MRIAYLCSRYPAVSHTFVLGEVSALRARGLAIDTFTIRRSPPHELLTEADREAARTTFAVLPVNPLTLLRVHLAAAGRSPGAYLSTLLRALRLSRPGLRGLLWPIFYFAEAMLVWSECSRRAVDHIHVHFANVASDVALLAVHFGRRAGGPRSWSFTMHGPAEFYEVSAHRLDAKTRDAAFVACISDFARSQLMSLVEESHWSRLAVIRCGVDTTALAPDRSPGSGDGSLEVLSVARLSARKGHAVLLHALAELATDGVEVGARIVGDGPERPNLERLAATLGLAERVRFLGATGPDRIATLHREADVFCLPSFGEGVPVVLMEAMSLGTPVVATNVMGVSELVESGRSGLLVAPGRADALAAALRRLAEQPELRRSLADEARETVVHDYDLGRLARELEQRFRLVASSPR